MYGLMDRTALALPLSSVASALTAGEVNQSTNQSINQSITRD